MDRKHVADFRDLLEADRLRLMSHTRRMDKAIRHADGEFDSSAGRAYSNHLADQGSDEAEYETKLLLSASQRENLREIEEALQRIEDGTYGICEITGENINLDRLQAIPHARLSIQAQEELERAMQ